MLFLKLLTLQKWAARLPSTTSLVPYSSKSRVHVQEQRHGMFHPFALRSSIISDQARSLDSAADVAGSAGTYQYRREVCVLLLGTGESGKVRSSCAAAAAENLLLSRGFGTVDHPQADAAVPQWWVHCRGTLLVSHGHPFEPSQSRIHRAAKSKLMHPRSNRCKLSSRHSQAGICLSPAV